MQALSIHESLENLKLVVNPSATAFSPVHGSETWTTYLDKCKKNILAELWGFYSSKINPKSRNWRTNGMEMVYLENLNRGGRNFVYVGMSDEIRPMNDTSQDDLAWNMVLYQNQLCVLYPRYNKDTGEMRLTLVKGKCIEDPYDSGSIDFLHVLGYIRPYVRDLDAITLLKKKPSQILKEVAAPQTRSVFDFNSERSFLDTVPSNELQRSIIGSLGSTIECIQGPPGTGKSTTIFHIVYTRLPAYHRAIVTCVQNKAVDSIAEKLEPHVSELPFIVIGRPGRMGDVAARFTVEAQAQRSEEVLRAKRDHQRAEDIHRRLEVNLERYLGARIPESRPYWIRRSEELKEKKPECRVKDLWRRWWVAYVMSKLVEEIEDQSNRIGVLKLELPSTIMNAEIKIRENARVVLCTLDGLASAEHISGPTIAIVDEAGTVPEFKIPMLVSLGVEAIVAIGDQKQLRPFTYDTEHKQTGFFQRTVAALRTVPMLKEQYRMHPDICAFVSRHFYNGELTTNPVIAAARAGGGISWCDYADESADLCNHSKFCNLVEVEILAQFMTRELPRLLECGKSVAVITFYKDQFQRLMKTGEEMGLVRTKREMMGLTDNKLASTRFRDPNFRIVTVDAAQGSEADVVLLSCVRCNLFRDLGFLTNPNRMCVALSRAREQLVIIGSSRTLRSDSTWAALYAGARVSFEEVLIQ